MARKPEASVSAPVITRRSLFALTLVAPAVAYATAAIAADTCVDLDTLPSGQKSLRQSLNFKTVSDDKRHCSGCSFFTASASDGGCGTCQIFNGPTTAQGRCDSWAPRKS